jgi:hypothetical protein
MKVPKPISPRILFEQIGKQTDLIGHSVDHYSWDVTLAAWGIAKEKKGLEKYSKTQPKILSTNAPDNLLFLEVQSKVGNQVVFGYLGRRIG